MGEISPRYRDECNRKKEKSCVFYTINQSISQSINDLIKINSIYSDKNDHVRGY